jgi:vacuolar-type H+-ATPase catalytic subunit A/Vma1
MRELKNSFFIIVTLIVLNVKVSFTQEYSAYDLLKSCSNYKNWIEKNFDSPVDQQALFNMGKCQGILETTGKIMSTLCIERKRNANINKQLAANLEGVRTLLLVREYVNVASSIENLQKYSAQSLLTKILSNKWPCR